MDPAGQFNTNSDTLSISSPTKVLFQAGDKRIFLWKVVNHSNQLLDVVSELNCLMLVKAIGIRPAKFGWLMQVMDFTLHVCVLPAHGSALPAFCKPPVVPPPPRGTSQTQHDKCDDSRGRAATRAHSTCSATSEGEEKTWLLLPAAVPGACFCLLAVPWLLTEASRRGTVPGLLMCLLCGSSCPSSGWSNVTSVFMSLGVIHSRGETCSRDPGFRFCWRGCSACVTP